MIATVVLCAAVLGCMAYYLEKHIVILGTSLPGAYLALRSLSLIVGGWPPES